MEVLWGVVHSPPVRCPLPGIAHHVVEAVTVGGKGRDLQRTGDTALSPLHTNTGHQSSPQAKLRSPKSSHQLSSAELEHFHILHLNPAGWEAVITPVSSAALSRVTQQPLAGFGD